MNDVKKGMKKSSVRDHLKKKIDGWLKTIEDERVRKVAEENVIVTGGSIASMLLGERVNDYDIYFRTFDAAREIAEYYVKWFNDARGQSSNDYVPVCPEVQTSEFTDIRGNTKARILIYIKSAGVAGQNQKSYRYFEYGDPQKTREFAKSLKEEKPDEVKCLPTFLTNNTVSLDNDFQLVFRFYGEPGEIHETFDFVHAKCTYDYAANELILPQRALECLLSRTLVYNGSLYPIASMFRLRKFVRRGWNVSVGQMIKVAWQISELQLKNYDIIMDQLIGVDVAYIGELLDRLAHVDPEMIDSTYIASVVDEIFED